MVFTFRSYTPPCISRKAVHPYAVVKMDFYISSLAARIPCTRLHRQIQDPRGRSIMAFAVSNDGKIAAMATYPREQRSVESSVNVLFKDGKASRTSNYHKAVQRQRRLAERNNEIEYNVDHYIQQTLQMDALGHAVKEVGLSTPSLRHIIKDNNNNNNAESSYPCQPFLPCAVIMYDTMYFNPVEEFIYGYVRNNNFRRNMHREHRPAESNISESCNKPLQTGVPSTSKCLFKPTSVEFCCDDSLLVLTSSDSGAKVFALDTEYVELLCHYRPRLKDELCLESFKVLKCNVVLEDVRGTVPKIPECFLDHKAICQPCKAAVITDADNYKEEALPYTVILECIVCVTSQPPFLGVLYSKWPSGEVSMVAVQYLCSPLDISTIGHDFLISHFKTRTTKTKEFAVLNHIQKYWFLEPYIHDHIEYLIQCDKPLKSGYNKTLLSTEVGSKDYLEFHSLIALYSPDYNLYIMNQKGNILSHTTVPALEEGYFNIDVSGDGSMIAMIGAESIVIYHVLLWREENGAISVILDQHTRFPQVIGVGRREEILCACFGKDPGNRWMYVSVARGSVDAVLYVVDIALSKEKEPIKRTLNMNSSIFPCVVSMVAMNNFLIVMPRHQRFLTQLTQEHTDNSDDIYSRQFCHFPVLATNKEAITVNAEIDDIDEPAKDRFEILTLERKRQISLQNKPSCRINVSRWLDALYQYNALCMYKGRSITLGMDPHDFLLPPLRRVRQQFPFAYDAKQFYDPLVGLEFIGSPALMRAQCYEWVREAIARAGFMNQMLPLNVVYDHKLHMLDYVYAKICISQCDNPSEYLFSLRTNDFLRLQLINFPKISQRLDIPCDAQGLIPYDSSMIYKRIREVMPMVLSEYKMHPVPPKSRENLEREAFDIMRDQLLPELMDIPMPKVRKIIRDRLYRLRKKLAQLESYKFDGPTSAAHHEFYLDEIVRSDCRLPAFKDNVDPREVAMNEYAMRLRMKVLSSFYKMQRDDGPDFDEYRQ